MKSSGSKIPRLFPVKTIVEFVLSLIMSEKSWDMNEEYASVGKPYSTFPKCK